MARWVVLAPLTSACTPTLTKGVGLGSGATGYQPILAWRRTAQGHRGRPAAVAVSTLPGGGVPLEALASFPLDHIGVEAL